MGKHSLALTVAGATAAFVYSFYTGPIPNGPLAVLVGVVVWLIAIW